MSERHDNHRPDHPVDPALDALLRRTLGRGSLTPRQRRRHLEDLNLRVEPDEPELMSAIEPVTGAPHTISVDVASAQRGARSRRELLELAAVIAVVLLGAGLLIAQLLGNSDEGAGDPASQPVVTAEPTESSLAQEPTTAPADGTATPAPAPTATETAGAAATDAPERLYVIGRLLAQTPGAPNTIISSGRVTAIDGATGEQAWSLYAGHRVDATLSRDGQSLYAFSALPQGAQGELIALDAASGDEHWRVPLAPRVWWDDDSEPSGMALTSDGAWLYLLSCAQEPVSACDSSGPLWLTMHETATGEMVDQMQSEGCLGSPAVSPDGRTMYIVCADGGVRVIDLANGESEALPSGRPNVGHAMSADGRLLYVAAHEDGVYNVTIYDMDPRAVAHAGSVALVGEQPQTFLDLLAVSPDGKRLFVGAQSPGENGAPVSTDIFVDHAATLESVGRIAADPPVTTSSLAAGADNASVFAAHSVVERDPLFARTTITRFGIDGVSQIVAVLEHQHAQRLLSWSPPQSPSQPPSRDGASTDPGASATPAAGGGASLANPACPVTPLADGAPSDPRVAAASEHWLRNESGTIWAGLDRQYGGVWSAPVVVVHWWWRSDPDPLTVWTRRVGGDDEPSIAGLVSGHDRFRTRQTTIAFPEPGCWEVTASGKGGEMRFTVAVESSASNPGVSDYSDLLLNTEAQREALLEATGPTPVGCGDDNWTGPEFRTGFTSIYPWNLDGDGLTWATNHGALFTGTNDIAWVFPSEAAGAEPRAVATRLDAEGREIERLELPVEVAMTIVPPRSQGEPMSALVTDVAFPSSGCWRVEATVGEHALYAILPVRDLP